MKIKRLAIYLIIASAAVLGGTRQSRADGIISLGSRIPIDTTTFAIPINITGGANVIFWQVSLNYDPTDIKINDTCNPFSGDIYCSLSYGPQTEGDFFASDSPFNVFVPGIITLDPVSLDQAGKLLDLNNRFAGDPTNLPSGDGILAFVEFTVIGDGDSVITTENGSLESVPEPASVMLVVAGLALLGRCRFARRDS